MDQLAAKDGIELLLKVTALVGALAAALKWVLIPRLERAVRGALFKELRELESLVAESVAGREWRNETTRRLDVMDAAVKENEGVSDTVEHLVAGVEALRATMEQMSSKLGIVAEQLAGVMGELRGQREARRGGGS